MKLFKYLTILGISLMFMACNETPTNNTVEEIDSINKIELIGFHSTHRCFTCNSIEENTKYTLETFFPNEFENGIITYQILNVDEDTNYKMAEKYEATGTSLFVNVIVNNKSEVIDLTNFAFKYGKDQEAFSEELKLKIDKELKKL